MSSAVPEGCIKRTEQDAEIPETECFRREEPGARDFRQGSTVTVLHLVGGGGGSGIGLSQPCKQKGMFETILFIFRILCSSLLSFLAPLVKFFFSSLTALCRYN